MTHRSIESTGPAAGASCLVLAPRVMDHQSVRAGMMSGPVSPADQPGFSVPALNKWKVHHHQSVCWLYLLPACSPNNLTMNPPGWLDRSVRDALNTWTVAEAETLSLIVNACLTMCADCGSAQLDLNVTIFSKYLKRTSENGMAKWFIFDNKVNFEMDNSDNFHCYTFRTINQSPN